MPLSRLLIISNGHGEDSIAAEIVRRLPASISVDAYPTLGDGRAYKGVCPIVGPRRHLPSEGNRVRGSLVRDALAGFGIGPAMAFMRTEAKSYDAIVVVGDMLGVVMAWLSGNRTRIYLDVYKSGHANTYSAIERWVLRRTADLVLPRDQILADQLNASRIAARFAGNVMMDTIVVGPYDAAARRRNAKAIAILPGSRAGMIDNLAMQVEALRRVPGIEGVDVFAVLARSSDAALLDGLAGMRLSPGSNRNGDLGQLSDGRITIQLSTGSLGAVLAASDVVLGQAGTANLQAVGMGRPVVSFTTGASRAVRRRRVSALAGDGRILVTADPQLLATEVTNLLVDDADRNRRAAIGRERIGPPGAIDAIIGELTR